MEENPHSVSSDCVCIMLGMAQTFIYHLLSHHSSSHVLYRSQAQYTLSKVVVVEMVKKIMMKMCSYSFTFTISYTQTVLHYSTS